MKKQIGIIFISVVIIVTGLSIQARDGLVGHWPLTKLDGKITMDLSKNENNAAYVGKTLPSVVDSDQGKAMSFDGDGYFDCGTNSSLDIKDEISIAMWINVKEYPENYAVFPLSKWGNVRDANYVFYLFGRKEKTSKTVFEKIGLFATAENGWGELSAFFKIKLDTWYHLVFVYGREEGGRLYINGQEVKGRVPYKGALTKSLQPLRIGGSFNIKKDKGFVGLMRDVKLYNRALSVNDVYDIFQGGKRSKTGFSSVKGKNGTNILSTIPLPIVSSGGVRKDMDEFRLFDAIARPKSNGEVLIECENATPIIFQTDVFQYKGQVKRVASDYSPQNDDGEAVGSYLDYCTEATYHFSLGQTAKYAVWIRHWVPVVGQWNYALAIDDQSPPVSVNLLKSIPVAKKWFWVKTTVQTLSEGDHKLVVSNLHNGKRMDRIIITPDLNYTPRGSGGKASQLEKVTKGQLIFQVPSIVEAKDLIELSFTNDGGNGIVKTAISIDGGRHFQSLENKSDLKNLEILKQGGNHNILFKIDMLRTKESPLLGNVLLKHVLDRENLLTLSDGYIRLQFLKNAGLLYLIGNDATGSIYYQFQYPFPMWEAVLINPKGRREILASDKVSFVSAQKDNNTIFLLWEAKNSNFKVNITVKLGKKGVSEWSFDLINSLTDYSIEKFTAMQVPQITIGNNSNVQIVWPRYGGEIHPYNIREPEKVVYYPSMEAAFPWIDIFTKKEGFYMGIHDTKIVNTEIRSVPTSNGRGFRFVKLNTIPGGQSCNYTFSMGVHGNSWRGGARIYRNFFYSHYPYNHYTPWFRDVSGYVMGRGAAGYSGMVNYNKALETDFQCSIVMGVPYIQGWGSIFNGACPSFYTPRRDKGGAEQFKVQIERWRKAGGNIGYYFHGNSTGVYFALSDRYYTLPWSDYPESERPSFNWDWYVKNRYYSSSDSISTADMSKSWDREDNLAVIVQRKEEYQIKVDAINRGLKQGKISSIQNGQPDRYPPMSWIGSGFSSYLHQSISSYVKNYACNTSYLDTFSGGNRTDYNPYYTKYGDGTAAAHKLSWLKMHIKEMRKLDTAYNVLEEGACDIFGTQLAHMVSSMYTRAGEDSRIFRYTFPDQVLFRGGICNCTSADAKSRNRYLKQSFLYGHKLDLAIFNHPPTFKPEFSRYQHDILRLRQLIAPFLNYGIFLDVDGLSFNDPELEAYSHMISGSTNHIIPNSGNKVVTITIANKNKQATEIRYQMLVDIIPRYAFVAELGNPTLRPLPFTINNGILSFNVSDAELSAVIFIETVHKECQWTAIAQQANSNTISVDIQNFDDKALELTVNAIPENEKTENATQSITLAAGEKGRISFHNSENLSKDAVRLVRLEVFSSSYRRILVSGFGDCSAIQDIFKNGISKK